MKDLRMWGAVLLVSGTTIGAAMLALPVVTGAAGFFPSLSLFLFFWLYMTFTAFLLLEVNLWMKEQTNLLTMAKKTLGFTGQIISWVIYLFLLYSLTTAYLAGSGPIFIEIIKQATGYQLPIWIGPLPLLLIFSYFVYRGASFVDYANRFLMGALLLAFLLLLIFLAPQIDPDLLQQTNWRATFSTVSVISTSFGFHIIIPTLVDYLKRDTLKIRRAIFIGSLLPLLIYIIWEAFAIGIVPLNGVNGLKAGLDQGIDGATLISLYLKTPKIAKIAALFSLAAITTSFLGVSLSLRDFLADGFKIKKDSQGKLLLYLLTFAPPLAFSFIDPRAFLNALDYAGAFGVVTLLGLLPILMVWQGRYRQKRQGNFMVPGGRPALLVALFFSCAIIAVAITQLL